MPDVDAMQAPAADVISELAPAEPAPADVYLAVVDGTPVDAVMWDGVSDYAHPSGGRLVRADKWQGPAFTGPPEPPEVAAQRTQADRLRVIRQQLTDDLATVDTATIAQLRPILRRVIRTQRILIRVALDEPSEDEPTT